MPFVAECILCHQKVRLPDRSVGASVECPRCHSYFTAAPEQEYTPAAQRPAPSPPASPAAPAALAVQPAATPAQPAAAIDEAPLAPLPDPAPRLLIPVDAPPAPPTRPRIDPLAVAAFVPSLAALGCVWFYALGVLVIPLAVLGLLIGLVALAVGLLADRPRFVLATAASLANAVVIYAALFNPWLLGPTYELSRARAEVEAAVPHAVPLAGKSADGASAGEWPDATQFAVQVKKARIAVVDATVRPLEIAQTPKKKYTKESYLVLRLRVHQPAGGAEFASDAWGQGGTAQERRQPVLTDEHAKVYKAPASNLGNEAGDIPHQASEFPLGITDEVFVFEAPAADVQYLRLEMPATPWGGTGAIRFTIPRSMLRVDPAKMGKEKQ